MNFETFLGQKPKKLRFKKEDFKTGTILLKLFKEDTVGKYYVTVHAITAHKALGNFKELYNKINDFLIAKKIVELRDLCCNRTLYRGTMSIDSMIDFNLRFKRFAGDLFEKNNKNVEKYLEELYRT